MLRIINRLKMFTTLKTKFREKESNGIWWSLLEKQSTCESYYVSGRHSNVDCFYLAQNYCKLLRQTIRENANFICLFPQDLKNLNHILEDRVGSDMTRKEFTQLCKIDWEKQHGFVFMIIVIIDLILAVKTTMACRGLDEFYIQN